MFEELTGKKKGFLLKKPMFEYLNARENGSGDAVYGFRVLAHAKGPKPDLGESSGSCSALKPPYFPYRCDPLPAEEEGEKLPLFKLAQTATLFSRSSGCLAATWAWMGRSCIVEAWYASGCGFTFHV